MKIALYSPYLDSFGGGEKYFLTIAETLSQQHEVSVLLDSNLEKTTDYTEKYQDLHGLDLSKVTLQSAPIGRGNTFSRYMFLKKYEVFFYLTDGSVIASGAGRNFIHFQVPFKNPDQGLFNKLKLKLYEMAIYNSNFTKNIVEQSWDIQGKVIYPPVDVDRFKPEKKLPIILSVGRFFGNTGKKQDVLIECFRQFAKTAESKKWKLCLAGATMPGDMTVDRLKEAAKGLNVEFYPDISQGDLVKLFDVASIFWHAKGLGEVDPTKMEHFGIVAVEALAAGAVPIVTRNGGLVEIVNENNGLFFDDPAELVRLSTELIKNPIKMLELGKRGRMDAAKFAKSRFVAEIEDLIK